MIIALIILIFMSMLKMAEQRGIKMDIVQTAATCYIITKIAIPIIVTLLLLGIFIISIGREWLDNFFDF